MVDANAVIQKLRDAPQRTNGRTVPERYDEWRVVLTGEEREWLLRLVQSSAAKRVVVPEDLASQFSSKSYASTAEGYTTFDPELQFDIDRAKEGL